MQTETRFKTIKGMNNIIQKLFCEYKSVEAFWAASENVMTDDYCQTMFLRIANHKSHIIKLLDFIDKIRTLADEGNPYMQYAYARLHDILALEPDSVNIYEKYYTLAMEAGIADARMQLAFAWRDCDFGEVDIRRYRSFMAQALEEGSERAAQQKLYEMIFGADDVEPDTENALHLIDKFLKECDYEPDPYYYRLMAMAEEKLGMKEEAAKDYRIATQKGDSDSFYYLAIVTCCDDNCNVVDYEQFSEIMGQGQDAGSALAYIETSCLLNPETFDAMDDDTKARISKLLVEQLVLSSSMGYGDSAFLLGSYYEDGMYGLEQDYGKAWQLYSEGAVKRSAYGYESLSRMILEDGTAPEKFDEEFGYECAYRAYILGADTLETLIRGYKNGFLSDHAAVIEEFYLPRYEQELENEDCDEPEIEEDDWNWFDDPDIVVPEYQSSQTSSENLDELLKTCIECVKQAKEAMEEYNSPWQVAEFARKYADAAEILKGYEHILNTLYSLNEKMLEQIFDHPRLKLRILRIQLDVLIYIEAVNGHELGITEDISDEIDELSKCIALADEGRLAEIPQTGHLKRDPVEWTARWEQVIDEADRIAYENLRDVPRGMGWCFGFWSERKAALKKFGIDWRSPHLMNPGVLFD